MRDFFGVRSLRFLLFFSSIALQFLSGICEDDSGKNEEKKESKSSSTGSKIAVICLVIIAAVSLSFFLFKLWQKKKREAQYARLLKLFEEDDELELELGLQD
ncbi:uncharacterized protein LOC124918998 [Impatiens glandulifera]|uniref:uncharacterized protein LOC124918998 n=1 Tax=Impatiens glandulifera TaxID=253017 RepID=UPI001FB0870D|nr:uncharacterized protein LOC124918998 [Impatiens glandulifera]